MTDVIAPAVSCAVNETRAVLVSTDCYDQQFDKPSAKSLENRTSVSSVDSNISLSYDAAPFTPRSSIQCTAASVNSTPVTTVAIYSSSSGNESASGTETAQRPSDDDESIFEPPDDEQAKRIVDQVEYYFSDENIVKDAFLLKHVRRNKEGFVSLKLIASFKRVKHIARDWRAVRHALRRSTKLEVNEAGTKLRRRDPLPLFDQTTPSRTVVVVHLPAEQTTVETIAEMYRDCGEIASVRVLRPGNPLPADVRLFYNRHPEVLDSTNALVEFVRTESAHNALNRKPSATTPVRVLELNAPAAAVPKKKLPTKKVYRSVESAPEYVSSSETDDRYRPPSHVITVTAQQQQHHHHLQQKHNLIEQSYHPQRRWSRDSGMDSPTSCGSRSRSNSGVYAPTPERRLSGAGWDDHYGPATPSSCRSRSNSGVSIPDAFHMRRYSLPRQEPTQCCCCEPGGGGGSAPTNGGRRYSLGRDDGYATHPLSWRAASGENVNGAYRKDSLPEYYALRRDSNAGGDRRPSLSRAVNGPGANFVAAPRRLSDPDGRLSGLVRQRSINNMQGALGHGSDIVVRLPRGPDGGRGFQREIIEYALPE